MNGILFYPKNFGIISRYLLHYHKQVITKPTKTFVESPKHSSEKDMFLLDEMTQLATQKFAVFGNMKMKKYIPWNISSSIKFLSLRYESCANIMHKYIINFKVSTCLIYYLRKSAFSKSFGKLYQTLSSMYYLPHSLQALISYQCMYKSKVLKYIRKIFEITTIQSLILPTRKSRAVIK